MHLTRLFKQPEELLDAFTSYKESLIVEARKWPKSTICRQRWKA